MKRKKRLYRNNDIENEIDPVSEEDFSASIDHITDPSIQETEDEDYDFDNEDRYDW